MGEIETDSRGRVTIPKDVRERFGERYRLVELEDGVKLAPIPNDPVAALRDAASDEFKAATREEIRAAGLEEGTDQAMNDVR